MVNIAVKETNGLVLAYLGDAVWELFVREYFINKGYNIRNLNLNVKKHVNAKIQNKYLENILPNLSTEEKSIVNRAKNSNIKTFPRSCNVLEYRGATAFEALIAFFYITNNIEKIYKIIKTNIELESDEIGI